VTETGRVAVLIDCENVPAAHAEAVLAEAARHGTLSIKRAYGDFTAPHLKAWRDLLPRLAVQPVQPVQYTSAGKNGSDTALVVDAMDLLYTTQTDAFCIVSSDSDFTRLVTRLREAGKRVLGIGARTTAEPLRNACDRFTYLDLVAVDAGGPAGGPTRAPGRGHLSAEAVRELQDLLGTAVTVSARDDGWALLSAVGHYVVSNQPTFDSRDYGFPKLGPLVREVPGFEVDSRPTSGGGAQLWLRVAPA
jgi:hypothetical protein